jgi:hypothetical protein
VSCRAGRRRLVAAALCLIGALWAARASAATVIFIPPASPSAAVSEALVRARGELVSEGFVVEVVDAPIEVGSLEGREWIARLQADSKADAVVAMLGDRTPDAVEIRVVDPLTAQPIVRRMSFQPVSDMTAKALAIHTVELIRATFLELNLTPAPRRPTPGQSRPQLQPPAPVGIAAESAPRPPERVSVDVGATAIFDLDGGAPLLLPVVQVSWALRPWLLSHLAGAGFGTHDTISSGGSSAQISQQFAVAGASYRFRAERRLRPFLSLAAGVLHTSAQGETLPPDRGQEADQWSFLLDGGAGAWLALGHRLQAALALEAQVAEPYPAVRFAGAVVKTSTRPSLLLTITLGVWL